LPTKADKFFFFSRPLRTIQDIRLQYRWKSLDGPICLDKAEWLRCTAAGFIPLMIGSPGRGIILHIINANPGSLAYFAHANPCPFILGDRSFGWFEMGIQ
jgi:hypothetical protein